MHVKYWKRNSEILRFQVQKVYCWAELVFHVDAVSCSFFSSRHCFVVFLVTPALFYFFDVFIIGVTRFAFLLHDHIPMCLHTVACWDCFPKDCHGRRKNCSWRLFCFRWRLLCIIIIVYSKFLKSYAHSFVSAVLV